MNSINTFSPKGKIITSSYNRKLLPINGIRVESDLYELNNIGNQIIKSALIKLSLIGTLDDETRFFIDKLLNDFSNIHEYQKNLENLDDDIASYFSTNPYYPIILEYSVKILKDFKLGYSNDIGGSSWNIFLENSNNVFEKYIRIVLERGLKNNVQKWNTPKTFAEIFLENKTGTKSFSPDIIIDYNGSNARAVFDVKNKKFEPNNSNLSDLVDLSDIYQLLFYSNQLNCDVCGLIFPTSNNNPPILLNLLAIDIKFYLIGINMKDSIQKRNKNLSNDILSCLQYT